MRYSTNILTLLMLVLVLAACSSSPSQESAGASESGSTAEEQASGEEESVAVAFDPIKCVRYTPSGTRISQKVCKKQSEWDRLREESQRSLGDVQRRSGHENQTL